MIDASPDVTIVTVAPAERPASLNVEMRSEPLRLTPVGFACPGGQEVVLVAVSYSNVYINDITTGASAGPFAASYTNPAAP